MSQQAIEYKAGVLKWYDSKRGYGFIIPQDESPDVFIHGKLFDKRCIEPEQFMRLKYRDTKRGKGKIAYDLSTDGVQ